MYWYLMILLLSCPCVRGNSHISNHSTRKYSRNWNQHLFLLILLINRFLIFWKMIKTGRYAIIVFKNSKVSCCNDKVVLIFKRKSLDSESPLKLWFSYYVTMMPKVSFILVQQVLWVMLNPCTGFFPLREHNNTCLAGCYTFLIKSFWNYSL